MANVQKEAAAVLAAGICRGRLWASPEETAAWLETKTGQRIASMIEAARAERK